MNEIERKTKLKQNTAGGLTCCPSSDFIIIILLAQK